MEITRGLIIDAPPIDRILDGIKTWEMRSSATKVRGRIALIRKGSGTVVGTVDVVGSIGPLTRDDVLANGDRHHMSMERIANGEVDKWRHAWVLQNVSRLPRPIPYSHPSGAVIWVNLDSSVTNQLRL